jgi:hypothetical protein
MRLENAQKTAAIKYTINLPKLNTKNSMVTGNRKLLPLQLEIITKCQIEPSFTHKNKFTLVKISPLLAAKS